MRPGDSGPFRGNAAPAAAAATLPVGRALEPWLNGAEFELGVGDLFEGSVAVWSAGVLVDVWRYLVVTAVSGQSVTSSLYA